MVEREVAGQASWVLANEDVTLAVTQLGAHMAPVHFCKRSGKAVQPYYISPWQGEGLAIPAGTSEVVQRGDFFCLPFGLDRDPSAMEKFPAHGETCGLAWRLVRNDAGSLTIERELTVRPGMVRRSLSVVDGEDVVYDEIVIDGFAGPATYAHHAMLRGAELSISTSAIRFGMTVPYATDEGHGLASGREFEALDRVPGVSEVVDCSQWPAREGCTDLLQLGNADAGEGFGWTAVVNAGEGYVWYALKDAAVMPSVVMWMENRGRQASPYNGRSCVIGLEDCCSYFDRGIPESAEENAFSKRGVSTFRVLSGEPFYVRYIQGVVRVPTGFGNVAEIKREGVGIRVKDVYGVSVWAAVQVEFLSGARLETGS